jgi:hypothetical protein
MEDSAMKKDVGTQLPKKIFLPNENGDEGEVVDKVIIVDFGQTDFYYFLKEVDRHHDHH